MIYQQNRYSETQAGGIGREEKKESLRERAERVLANLE